MTSKEICGIVGKDYLYDVLIEECAELVQALIKYRRSRKGFDQHLDSVECWENVIEECADVELMLEIIKSTAMRNEDRSKVVNIVADKYRRFKDRIGGLT